MPLLAIEFSIPRDSLSLALEHRYGEGAPVDPLNGKRFDIDSLRTLLPLFLIFGIEDRADFVARGGDSSATGHAHRYGFSAGKP